MNAVNSGPLILIVEDDLDLRDSLQLLLETEHFRVVCAGDGLEAMAQLRELEEMPALILLDWMMPRMDGAGFCVARESIPAARNIPIVILTADGKLQDKMKIACAVAGLDKPIDIDVLLSEIRKITG